MYPQNFPLQLGVCVVMPMMFVRAPMTAHVTSVTGAFVQNQAPLTGLALKLAVLKTVPYGTW